MPSHDELSRYILVSSAAQGIANFREEQSAERERFPANVFVSYSCRDRVEARSICLKLFEAGVDYFLDEKQIEPGTELSDRLEEEIRQRRYYLLLLSEHSVASHRVTFEWAFAKGVGCKRRISRMAWSNSIAVRNTIP